MKPLTKLSKKNIEGIKLLVFDVDGIIVKRGTKIEKRNGKTIFLIKKVSPETISLLKRMNKIGFKINISSGRSLSVLKEMFSKVLNLISITYENGSATWIDGVIHNHVKRYQGLEELYHKLNKIEDKRIKGFEPKEFILTLHSYNRIKGVEEIAKKYRTLYYIWNSEAYDIGLKGKQTKLSGLKQLLNVLKLGKNEVLFVGDNYNDRNLSKSTKLVVSADKKRLNGDFFVKLSEKNLPANQVMKKISSLRKNDRFMN